MNTRIRFSKMHGAGNDFVVIDNRSLRIRNRSLLARRVCDRYRSVGADGLLLLERSSKASYRMRYYNADGSSGGMCGNGGRCIALFATALRVVERSHSFEALGHIYQATVMPHGNVLLRMKDPTDMRVGLTLTCGKSALSIHTVDTGSPHSVVFLQRGRLATLDVESLGRWIRNHPRFRPNGINANFAEQTGAKSLRMRTFERGVEAETMACGTGSIACSVIGAVTLGILSPVSVHTRSGQILRVHFERDGLEFSNVVLEGPAEITYVGEFNV